MKWFSEKLLAIEMNKTEAQTIKEVYLGLPGSKMSKIVMYEYWYDYTRPEYGDMAKLFNTDTDSFT